MFSWHAIPFARALIPFITGIIVCLYCPSGTIIPACILSILLLVLFFFKSIFKQRSHFKLRIIQGILLSLCILTLGYFRTYWYNETRLDGHFASFKHAKFYHITVDDAVIEKKRFYRCYATVEEVNDSLGKTYKSQGSLLLYFNKHHTRQKPLVGERFIVRANASRFNDPANPGEFNYKQYLSRHNIHYQLFADSVHTFKSEVSETSLYRLAIIFRDQCLDIIRKHIQSPRELGVAEALLLGYKDDLDPDITSAFSRTGTLHVLAVSGLHAGIIFLLISFLTRSLKDRKRGKWVQLFLLLAGLWFYAFMTGLSSSVLRASVMFSIMSIGKILKHKPNIYNTLFASAFLLLLYNPLYIFDVGFQLSYLAVLGIVWIQPMISAWYNPRYKFDKYIWDLLSVSLAAQFLTFPISLFYFHQFPNYFLLSNMLIIPLTTLILVGLIILLAVNWIPLMAVLTGKILYGLIWFSNWLVTAIDRLPYSFMNGLYLNFLQLVFIYGIILFLISFLVHKKPWLLFCFLTCTLLCTCLLSYYRYEQNHQRVLVAHQVKGHDVFTCIEGRKAYIISDKTFLSDSSAIHFFLEPYLWEKGINTIVKLDQQQNFVATNIRVFQDVGFQFYDNIMTIQNTVQNTIQKGEIVLLKRFDKNLFSQREKHHNSFIISLNLTKKDNYKLKKEYFNHFHKNLELNKKALMFFY